MKALKRFAGAACALMLAVSGTALADYKPGTYEEVVRGMGGKVYFEITFDETSLVDIKITKHHETEGFGDRAIENVIPAIIAAQSTEVDNWSGATITSEAIKKAVTQAMEEAYVEGEAAPAGAAFVPGTYEEVVRGMGGKVYFEITFDENSLVDIKITKHHETEGFGDRAIENVIPAIIAAQSTEVDNWSGATITSEAIKKAVTLAMEAAAVPAAAEAIYKPGTYEEVVRGMGGKVYFEITFDETSLVDIKITKHHETEGFGDRAIENVIPAILAAQSTEVDNWSGATITSEAIKKAVTQAMAEAAN